MNRSEFYVLTLAAVYEMALNMCEIISGMFSLC